MMIWLIAILSSFIVKLVPEEQKTMTNHQTDALIKQKQSRLQLL